MSKIKVENPVVELDDDVVVAFDGDDGASGSFGLIGTQRAIPYEARGVDLRDLDAFFQRDGLFTE